MTRLGSHSKTFVLGVGLAASAAFAQSPADTRVVDKAAVAVARTVDGTITPCPASYTNFTAAKACVRVPYSAERTKMLLNRSEATPLVTAWRSQRNPIFSYNYVRQGGAVVAVIAGPAPGDAKATLLVLDTVPTRAEADLQRREDIRITPKVSPPAAPNRASETVNVPPFRRSLALASPHLNGEDVRLLQERLIEVARIPRGTGGDGWYGPVTAATVKAFQAANGLRVTGVVDQGTWSRLFSDRAQPFEARSVDTYLGR
ncbi:peptidoglycan-binding domain-containing protein [Deinococcus yavapaiensis]|uniref:Putative peptidoglycan binding protein n=1 Tax=Deinococcus yavapaiensis KR-236 TaxID=694435 RepID=A0A318SCL5_9DEIO|nr:peptidoglycan-binding domain-containing protein [Deinococcus yavapaiensis]PYE54994.1 putative peptidoglycan binding protein [Deinococcus yavapaiensis KR-236]